MKQEEYDSKDDVTANRKFSIGQLLDKDFTKLGKNVYKIIKRSPE